jgi:hypothetical protein
MCPSAAPALHETLAWFATADVRLLGALIRDRVDNDYGWVVLARNDTANIGDFFGRQANISESDTAVRRCKRFPTHRDARPHST